MACTSLPSRPPPPTGSGPFVRRDRGEVKRDRGAAHGEARDHHPSPGADLTRGGTKLRGRIHHRITVLAPTGFEPVFAVRHALFQLFLAVVDSPPEIQIRR